MRLGQMRRHIVREGSAGAEAVNHNTAVRVGLIRHLGASAYVFLAAGWCVVRKIEDIFCWKMESLGRHEFLVPLPSPADNRQLSPRSLSPA
jgi:prolyl-tRNA synthetase